MTTDLTVFVALGAGFLSFLSPCVLPLIPSYLTFIGGVSFSDLQETKTARTGILIKTLFFVLGFSTVFVTLGLLLSGTVLAFGGTSGMINFAAGGLVILLGLNIIFDFIKFLNYEKRVHLNAKPKGYGGAFLLGLAFGAGWSPCIGPILGGILFLAGQDGETAKAAILLSAYSIGLGLPFFGAAIFFDFFLARLKVLNRYGQKIKLASGSLLIFIGFLIMTGRFQELNRLILLAGSALADWAEGGTNSSIIIPAILLFALGLLPFLISAAHGGKLLARGKILFFPPLCPACLTSSLRSRKSRPDPVPLAPLPRYLIKVFGRRPKKLLPS